MPTALITGAGRGIGLATARAFLAAGGRVLALDKAFGPEIAGERLDFDLRRTGEIASLVAHLTKSWARELGPHGVLVSAVAPGPTLTAMYEQLPDSRKEGVMRSVYSGRICRPEEVASAILWLGAACPEYVNGTTLDVNNGSYPR